ncbi:MAG: TonB-dependent receptor [Pseudomonadota bacterium]
MLLKNRVVGVAAAATAIVSFSPLLAVAQNNPLVLDEIVVTAQKRVESLQDVPVAVSAFTGDGLERAQVRDLVELQQLAPSLVVNSSTGSTNTILTIRGIGTAGNNTGLEQSVGVFIDGVYRGRIGAAMTDIIDIEQIEVLRGPQSTLFGKNTSAGVISINTRRPEFEWGGVADLAVGDFGLTQVRGSITGPISDSIAFRLSGAVYQRDGVVDDLVDGREYNDRDRISGRGQLLWDIADTTTLRVIADYTDTNDECCVANQTFAGPLQPIVAAIGGPGSVQTLAGPSDAFSYNGVSTPGFGFDNGFIDGGISAELEHDFEGVTMNIIGASRIFETFPDLDADYQRADIIGERIQAQDIEEQSFEIRFASNDSENFEWLAGGYYFNQDIIANDQLGFGADGRAFGDAVLQALSAGALNFATLEGLFGLPAGSIYADGSGTRNDFDYSASGFAVFGQGTWYVNDRWSLTFGLRYSDEEKDATAINTLSNEPLSQIPLPPTLAGVSALQLFPTVDDYTSDFSDDNVTGTFNIGYELTDDVSTYLRYATGFKSGGINLSRNAAAQVPGDPTPNLADVTFDSETVDSIELGLKARLGGGRANVNVAVFSQTLEDFQANSFDGLSFAIRNAAEVQSNGIEVDFDWLVSETLQFKGGVVLQDVEYDSFPGASATNDQINAGMPVQDLTGETPNFVSDFTFTGSLIYTQPLSSTLNLIASTDIRYRSEFATGQDLDPNTDQDDLLWVNASIGLEHPEGNWAVQAWVKNATEEEVFNIVFDSSFQAGSFHSFIEDPRQYGLTATFRF